VSAVLVIVAHPDLARSRVTRAFAAAAAAAGPSGVAVRDLYALYPDYLVDIEAEQRALQAAHTVVWLHPIHWYSMPPLMKLWLDEVFTHGWAYGPGGQALRGKRLMLAVSTGGTEAAYGPSGTHQRPFDDFLPAYRQTAALCGMRFLMPRVLHGAHRIDDDAIAAQARAFGTQLATLAATRPALAPATTRLSLSVPQPNEP
jgi:glutathione-regulated potassium-efflux system ancillary protein KefF